MVTCKVLMGVACWTAGILPRHAQFGMFNKFPNGTMNILVADKAHEVNFTYFTFVLLA